MTDEKRPLTADDLYRMELVTDCRLAPNGRHAVYVVQRVDRKTEKKHTNLWVVAADGETPPRQFTYGDHNDSRPRWSPDGQTIAFLSNRGDEKQAQIYLLPFGGGEGRPLTDLTGTIGSFEWSPDGARLLLNFRQKDAAAIEREKDEQKKKLGVVARHIRRTTFRVDGMGYLPEERWHIWTVDAADGTVTQLTAGDRYDEGDPVWSPDGERIVFTSNRSEEPDLTPQKGEIFAIPSLPAETPVPDESWQTLPGPEGNKYLLSWSPDGRWLAYVGNEGRGDWWKNNRLYIMPGDGSGEPVDITGPHDLHVASSTLGDSGERVMMAPVWTMDSQALYFQVTRHGGTDLYRINRDGSEPTAVIDEAATMGEYTFDAEQARLAYVRGTLTALAQVWVRDMASGEGRQLTQLNANWLDEVELGAIEERWFTGRDGNDLQGWILTPPDFDSRKQYPTILEIHGGPWLQYGYAFMHEFYYLAAQGYVVGWTNPRGGQGYGEAHGQAIHRNWGDADYADVMAWADVLAAEPYVDTKRFGITGGSYGGYMTAWTIGHTDRFQAAVVQRVVSNALSFWGSSDVGMLFDDPWSGKPPWEDLAKYWDQSPMKYITHVQTPTLLIHSEQDYRCDIEQSVQMYRALRLLGVPTELVLFPDESHGLSRAGRTDRRIVRLEHIKRWFEKYLSSVSPSL